jgi:AcrR family transcriptional regulator
LRAALDLIAEKGWRAFTLADAAKRANLELEELRERYPSRGALLDAIFAGIDARVAAEGSYEANDSNPARDRLFDVLMRRFEALNAERAAILRLVQELPLDPKAAARAACRLGRSLQAALGLAGLETRGPKGMVRLKGLGAIYLYALNAWRADESADLSATMAALDRGLRVAENALSALRALGDAARQGVASGARANPRARNNNPAGKAKDKP